MRKQLGSGSSPGSILQEMKAIELTGDPITATGAAMATLQQLVSMSSR